VKLAEELLRLDPASLRIREKLVILLVQVGRAESERGQFALSEQDLGRAVRESEEMVEAEPELHSLHVLLYSARANLAQMRESMARDVDAPRAERARWCRDAIEHFLAARRQLEGSRGDATMFGDRELLLGRLQQDHGRVLDLLAELEGATAAGQQRRP
jgi:hypothetical protein